MSSAVGQQQTADSEPAVAAGPGCPAADWGLRGAAPHTRAAGYPALLADDAALGAWLAREIHWPADCRLRGAALRRVWPGRSGRLSFELSVEIERADGEIQGTMQGICGTWPDIRQRREVTLTDGALSGLLLTDSSLGVSLCTADLDPHLPAVARLLDSRQAAELLLGTVGARRLGLDQGAVLAPPRLAAWRINKRCMLALHTGAQPESRAVYVKALRRLPDPDVLAAQRRLRRWFMQRSAGRIGTPLLLDVDPHNQLMIQAAVDSGTRPLGPVDGDLRAAARALALLHAAPIVVGRVHPAAEEVRIAGRWIRPLQRLRLPLAAELRSLIHDLARRIRTIPAGEPVLVHRDFHTAQVLCGGEQLWIVDLDTLSLGDAEVDVSTGCSHLVLDALRAGAVLPDARKRMCEFIQYYRGWGPGLDPHRLRFYLASALLRLGALHAARGLPEETVRILWLLAQAQLQGGSAAFDAGAE